MKIAYKVNDIIVFVFKNETTHIFLQILQNDYQEYQEKRNGGIEKYEKWKGDSRRKFTQGIVESEIQSH